jgi:hypothetical protein
MDLPRIETRMLRWMIALAILGVISILATAPLLDKEGARGWYWQAALGFAIGAALGILNFHWLWRTGMVLMDIQTGRVPRVTVFLIVLRYPLSFAGLFMLFYSGWLSPLPVIAGLLVPCAGVLLESLLLVRADLRQRQELEAPRL